MFSGGKCMAIAPPKYDHEPNNVGPIDIHLFADEHCFTSDYRIKQHWFGHYV